MRRAAGGREELGGATYSRRGRLEKEGARWHARGYVSALRRRARAANCHGEGREGDEGEPDDAQELTESGNARGREGEEDTGVEDDGLTGTHCAAIGMARWRRKRRGRGVQQEEDVEGEL